jgi:hypothetical protein
LASAQKSLAFSYGLKIAQTIKMYWSKNFRRFSRGLPQEHKITRSDNFYAHVICRNSNKHSLRSISFTLMQKKQKIKAA